MWVWGKCDTAKKRKSCDSLTTSAPQKLTKLNDFPLSISYAFWYVALLSSDFPFPLGLNRRKSECCGPKTINKKVVGIFFFSWMHALKKKNLGLTSCNLSHAVQLQVWFHPILIDLWRGKKILKFNMATLPLSGIIK